MNRLRVYPLGVFFTILSLLLGACTSSTAAADPASTSTASQPPAAAANPTAPAASSTDAPAASAPTAAAGSPASNPGAASAGAKYELTAGSQASYAVREQLASLSMPSDAVGTTSDISGAVIILADGAIDAATSKFVVNATTLHTDSGMRDGYVSQRILQTSQYPEILFVPKSVSGLPSALPASGDVSFQITGDLTIRSVTKSVTWDVTGSLTADGKATGKAVTSFTFEDFDLAQPQVRSVLSVVDKITLTVSVVLQKAAS